MGVMVEKMPKSEVKSPNLSPSGGRSQSQQQVHSMQQSAQQQQQQGQQSTQMPNNANTHVPASTGEGRRISCADIQLVQNLIERCLQLYMNRKEVVDILLNQAKIEPNFTGLVWQKLEEQNPDFFKAYYVRLKLKKQIMVFNQLLEHHAQLTQKVHTIKPAIPALQNGLHPPPVHHMPIGYPVSQQPPMAAPNHPHYVQMPAPSPPNPPVIGSAPVAEGFVAAHGSPNSNNLNSDMSMLQTNPSIPLNGDLGIFNNTVLQGSSAFPVTGMGNPTDISGIGMDVPANFPPDASFHSTENHTQNGVGGLQISGDTDSGGGRESISLLSHLPRNFSLSDLTADTDILGSYMGSPYLTDADAFIQNTSDDEKMLHYEDFDDEK